MTNCPITYDGQECGLPVGHAGKCRFDLESRDSRKDEKEIRNRLEVVRDVEDSADPSRPDYKRMKGQREALEWVLGEDDNG